MGRRGFEPEVDCSYREAVRSNRRSETWVWFPFCCSVYWLDMNRLKVEWPLMAEIAEFIH